ncbi:MAG: phosphate ABC transporter substrate-binding protein [Pseudomonadales bacterium]|nr:phosphate ABC transporter substrate-binding protein [Pseudomonadales bacterium]
MKKRHIHNLFISSFSLLSLVLASTLSLAGVVVVVSTSNANTELDEKQIYNIYMGKSKSFPDGEKVLPIDQKKGSANREAFRESILQKSSSQLNTYWSRLIFTGKGTPPQESGNASVVKDLVGKNPNLIGYIDSSDVDSSVKVLYEL